jgi:hypothetical protein
MAEIPEGHIVHKTKDRVRVKIPARRHDGPFFTNSIQELSRKMPEAKMEANPATATILIRCADVTALLGALGGAAAPFWISSQGEDSAPTFEHLRQEMKGLNEKFRHWTGSASDARIYIFLALLLSALYQAARGEIFAPAATLLWYAGEALRFWAPQTKIPGQASREAEAQAS